MAITRKVLDHTGKTSNERRVVLREDSRKIGVFPESVREDHDVIKIDEDEYTDVWS